MTTATEQRAGDLQRQRRDEIRAADLQRQRRDEIPTYFAEFLLELGRVPDDDLRGLLERRKEVQRQMVEYAESMRRRVATDKASSAVVEARPALPTVEQTLAELEKRARLDRAEILGCFRQGRRSAEQRATRERVERAVRAMVAHYTMVHPIVAEWDTGRNFGPYQIRQARKEWPAKRVGWQGRNGRDDKLLLITFGELEDDEGEVFEVGYFIRSSNRQSDSPRRNRKRRPHIAERIATALNVSVRTIRTILAAEV
jgi:hypothetical protein